MKDMIEAHRFFLRESPRYMEGTSTWKYYLRFPVAYIRFMWFCYKEFRKVN